MGHIAIEQVRCKGCGRCVVACPKNLIEYGTELNERGYNYVIFKGHPEDCGGCTLCAVSCPDQGDRGLEPPRPQGLRQHDRPDGGDFLAR